MDKETVDGLRSMSRHNHDDDGDEVMRVGEAGPSDNQDDGDDGDENDWINDDDMPVDKSFIYAMRDASDLLRCAFPCFLSVTVLSFTFLCFL